MNNRNLLFITEGPIDEPSFIHRTYEKCYPNVLYDFYSYKTTIHTLTKLIFNKEEEIDEYLDILKVLKEQENNTSERIKLSRQYTDIILVFDFEPRCDSPEFDKVYKMLKFFNDSSNNGKLYINYPMMQSYKHLKCIPDQSFKDSIINNMDAVKYKEIVGKESFCTNLNKYTFPTIMSIIGHHLKKANYILYNSYTLPTKDEFYNINCEKIYKIQHENKEKKEWIYILNTFVFNIVEYNPTIILNKIKSFL